MWVLRLELVIFLSYQFSQSSSETAACVDDPAAQANPAEEASVSRTAPRPNAAANAWISNLTEAIADLVATSVLLDGSVKAEPVF
jgi:hypothetical protein